MEVLSNVEKRQDHLLNKAAHLQFGWPGLLFKLIGDCVFHMLPGSAKVISKLLWVLRIQIARHHDCRPQKIFVEQQRRFIVGGFCQFPLSFTSTITIQSQTAISAQTNDGNKDNRVVFHVLYFLTSVFLGSL